MSPQEAAELRSQGWTDAEIAGAIPVGGGSQSPSGTITPSQTIGKTLHAHAGGILGGGAGVLGLLGLVGAPETLGGSLLLTAGAAGTGLGGSLLGQKAQESISDPATYAALQQQANEVAAINPKTALGTDIAASALASGGLPSANALRASAGLIGKLGGAEMSAAQRQALGSTILNAGINPAINTGLSLATGQGLPSGSELAGQVAGGALFSGSWVPHGGGDRLPLKEDSQGNTEPEVETTQVTTPFTAKNDDGGYNLSDKSVRGIYIKRNTLPLTKKDDVSDALIRQYNDEVKSTPVARMRDQLHQEELGKSQQAQELLQGREFEENQKADKEQDIEQSAREGDEESYQQHQAPLTDYNRYTELMRQMKVNPSIDTWQGIEAIKNKYGGNLPPAVPEGFVPTPDNLQRHIIGQRATTGSVLQMIANAPDHDFAPLAKHLLDIADTKSLGVKWNYNPDLDKSGAERSNYNTKHDDVSINTADSVDSRAVMEEAIHSLTSQKLPDFKAQGLAHYDELVNYLTHGSNDSVKDLIKSYLHVAKTLGHDDKLFGPEGVANNADLAHRVIGANGYALGDLHEFIAQAFKDPDFQRTLDGIKDPTNDKRTVWQGIVDAVRKLLGIDAKNGTMLDRVLRSGSEVVAQKRGGVNGNSGIHLFNKSFDERANDAAQTQRGIPENQMLSSVSAIQKAGGGGILTHQLEHLGDLAHRAQERDGIGMSGLFEKVRSISKVLWPQKGWMNLEQEIEHSNRNNAEYSVLQKHPEITGERSYDKYEKLRTEHKEEIQQAYEKLKQVEKVELDKYVKAHQEYNQPITELGRLGKQASVYYGKQDFQGLRFTIDKIERILEKYKEAKTHEEKESIRLSQGNEKHYAPPSKGQSETAHELQLPPDIYMGRIGNITRATLDKVRDIGTAPAKKYADAAQLALNKTQELKGELTNKFNATKGKLSATEDSHLMSVINKERSLGKSFFDELNPSEQKAYLAAKKGYDSVLDKHTKLGMPIYQVISKNGRTISVPREMAKKENAWPQMANQNIINDYKSGNGQLIAAHDALFDKFNKSIGMSDEESAERIGQFKKSIDQSPLTSPISAHQRFNATRKSQGSPLPPEFTERSFTQNMTRYFDRAAADMAHYEHLEKSHDILAAQGITHDAWNKPVEPAKDGTIPANNPAVQASLAQWQHHTTNPNEHNEHSLSSAITAGFVSSPALEGHVIGSNIISALAGAPNAGIALRALGRGLVNIRSGYTHAVEGGVYKLDPRSSLRMITGGQNAAERMQGLAKLVRDIASFGQLTRKFNAGLMQAMGESIVPSRINRAEHGDIESQKWIRNLDPTYVRGKQYTDEEATKLASQFASYLHGTGDIRTLPAWMLNDSEISGFFTLAHWSVARTNAFMKDIYEPATRGNVAPLFTALFGAVVGGYMIKRLREEVSGRKNPIPSLTEIASSDIGASGNVPLLAYNTIAAMQYAGFGGLLSQVAKYPFDIAYKNNPQSMTFPLDEVASDVIHNVNQITSSMANDPNFNIADAAAQMVLHTLSSNIQLARIGMNQAINNGLVGGYPADKKMLGDKLQQLRRFDMVEGLPYADVDESSNPYTNLEQKKFHLEQDPAKAVAMLPPLINNIIAKYGNNPDVMLNKIKALKQNQYNTFPAIENMPLQFMKYVHYLQTKEGPEAANAEVSDYFRHKITNEMKSAVVP